MLHILNWGVLENSSVWVREHKDIILYKNDGTKGFLGFGYKLRTKPQDLSGEPKMTFSSGFI